jgi:hypothetical protein
MRTNVLLQALLYLLFVSVVQLFVIEFVLHAVFARRRRSELGLDLARILISRCVALLAVEIGALAFLLSRSAFLSSSSSSSAFFHTCQFSLRIVQGSILHFVLHFLLCL